MLDVAHAFALLGQRGYVIPRPHPTLVTKRVLVMERLSGFAFEDVAGMKDAGVDTHDVVRTGMIGGMEGALIHGIFHGDLHGGNPLRAARRTHRSARLRHHRTLVGAQAARAAAVAHRRVDERHQEPNAGATRSRRAPRRHRHRRSDRRPRSRPPTDRSDDDDRRRVGGRDPAHDEGAARHRGAHAERAHALREEHDVLDGAIATLAPDLDIFGEIAEISMHFANTHGEHIAAELGLDPDAWQLDMSGVKAQLWRRLVSGDAHEPRPARAARRHPRAPRIPEANPRSPQAPLPQVAPHWRCPGMQCPVGHLDARASTSGSRLRRHGATAARAHRAREQRGDPRRCPRTGCRHLKTRRRASSSRCRAA